MAKPEEAVQRRLTQVVKERMTESPVILLEGPRTVGKSTLLRELAQESHSRITDFDDLETLSTAQSNPNLFATGPTPICIDEYQKAPVILDAIKARLNSDLHPGMFLLAGSTRFDALPMLAQSLTGRLHRVPVMPFTQAELDGVPTDFVERALAGEIKHTATESATTREDYIQRVTTGGFPMALVRPTTAARNRWFADHITLTLERDARETRGFANAAALRALLTRLAANTGQLLNISNVAEGLGIAGNTASSYAKLLEAVFLVSTLPAWGRTLTSRSVGRPKVHILDSGVGAHLMRLTPEKLDRRDPGALTEFGHLLESFVVQEVLRQASWLDDPTTAGHWRTRDDDEVDLIIERYDGAVLAIEVKAGEGVPGDKLASLARLRDRLGASFAAGVAFHLGKRGYQADDRLHVLPVDRLWT